MKTAEIFLDVFRGRTTGRRATYKIINLTLDVVKIVLKGVQIKLGVEGTKEDEANGFVRRYNGTGCYGGNDGYILTAKGYREIFRLLSVKA